PNRNLPTTYSANLPPPDRTCIAALQVVKVWICPSTPNGTELADYTPIEYTGLKLSRTDYFTFQGVSTNFQSACAPATPVDATQQGALAPKGTKPTLLGITDGTSNTMLYAEIAGRPNMYIGGKLVT